MLFRSVVPATRREWDRTARVWRIFDTRSFERFARIARARGYGVEIESDDDNDDDGEA